ncbi:hypothetical protein PLUTE_b0999 [Pseudoalteromonas luteoviolacea DSM 6061]|nr:hypothetical protein [Pseudoalteromonas luteoviolacea DSM 6061]
MIIILPNAIKSALYLFILSKVQYQNTAVNSGILMMKNAMDMSKPLK